MESIYLDRMKQRLRKMRMVAAKAHDPRIIKLVTMTADELEEDIRKLEAEAAGPRPFEAGPSAQTANP
jgi:hypothetical protein